jgi:carbonic anhydrase/acetyltransferase-like protein (isoleucine patch superfamily)
MTRLLSGASMDSYSILLEHTLVLAGDVVDSGSVLQGWPSNNHIYLAHHRERMKLLLDDNMLQRKSMQKCREILEDQFNNV